MGKKILENSLIAFKQPTGKELHNADVKACLSDLHNKSVFVPADKAPNNVIIICKRYYIQTLIKELGLDNCSTPTENSTYTSGQMSSLYFSSKLMHNVEFSFSQNLSMVNRGQPWS